MVHHNDDAMNKIPLKSATGADDEEKNGGEFIQDTATAEEARREQMRVNLLKWMKKLTIVLICFIGIALISYVVISLCFSDWSRNKNSTKTTTAPTLTTPTPSNNDTFALAAILSPLTTATIFKAPMQDEVTTPTSINPTTLEIKLSEPSTTLNYKFTTTTSTNNETETTPTAESETQNIGKNKAALFLDPPPSLEQNFVSKLGIYQKAGICSDKPVCSQIGSFILEKEGSAVDAAIAALLCNGLVTQQSMGIGGGMFMNIYIKEEKQAFTIDAREVAPFAATPEIYAGQGEKSLIGGLAIAVPGELMGYYSAHQRFGKLPWKTLIEPTIKLCEDGIYVTQHIRTALLYRQKNIQNNTILYNLFFNNKTGEMHPVGTKIKSQKELCETFKLLAKNGPLDFYNGTLSKLVSEDLEDLGSIVTSYDLESYTADLINSISMQLGDDILFSSPPVSSGTVVANILSILEGFNFTPADLQQPEKLALTVHRFTEAMKFGYAKRWELGDIRFNDVRELISKLTNPEFAATLRARINDSHVLSSIFDYDAQFTGEDDHGTSHMSILAPNGDAVSVTSSINSYFGALLIGKRTGIIFNNAMNDFSITEVKNQFNIPLAPTNYLAERKRPMSSMSPLILASREGDVRLVIGSAGGSKIIAATAQIIARVLWFKNNIKEAIDAPRFYNQLLPGELEYEAGSLSNDVIKILRSKGHITKAIFEPVSVACGIVKNETAIYVNADYRKRGGTAGF